MSDEFNKTIPPTLVQPPFMEDESLHVGDILDEANKLINGDRQQDYGPPDENFQNITALWNVRFKNLLAEGKQFKPSDIAVAMVLLKVARDMKGYKRDTAVDQAAYSDLYGYLAEKGL